VSAAPAGAAGEARHLLASSVRIAVFTGAGMSSESGLRTFRGADGFWRQHRAQDLATPEALLSDPVLVWEWFRERLAVLGGIVPHAGYAAIVELETRKPGAIVITQNVDSLHRQSGSKDVIELHGSLRTASCIRERIRRFPVTAKLLESLPPLCPCGALLRPDVVLFGEPLPSIELSRAFAAARRCDLMLVVGSSLLVHPAAAIPFTALSSGAAVVEINPEPTDLSAAPGVISIRGTAAAVLPEVIQSR
jgi:NAD-dependent deacetylase